MKVEILIPIHRMMDAPCVQSLLNMNCDFHDAGIQTKFCFANGFNAARARVGLAKYAGEDANYGADYYLWLDSDHIYQKVYFDELVKAIEANGLQMLSGSYKMRGSEETAHGITENGKFRHFHYKELNEAPEDKLFECDVVGFGFLVMKASFLKEMWAKYKEDLFKLDAVNNATEDVTFCNLVKQEGYKVMFHPKVRVGHMELCVRI